MKVAIYDAVYPWIKGGAEKRIYEVECLTKKHEVNWYRLDGGLTTMVVKQLPLWHNSARCFELNELFTNIAKKAPP